MSSVLDAIETKKRGGALSDELIRAVVTGYTAGEIPDYQMSALLMAVFTQGMPYEETLALTTAMTDSGERYSFPDCVDKHSTGGIGDKISLISLPIVAACGAPVAKLSGRGLGQTGGTVDKLEAIPGFTCSLSEEEFYQQMKEVGLAIVEAGELAPADKAIYALRDVTGTVDSLPLIGSSIVSKKAATGAGYLLYDVKCGSGAFMKTAAEARELAELLVRLSESLGIRASALITGMSQPLGAAVGNALELRESVALLKGDPVLEDLAHEARLVATRLLELKGVSEAEAKVERAISSGAAYEKLREFVAAQGGYAGALESLPVSSSVWEVVAQESGYVTSFDSLSVGQAALVLGASRERKSDAVDHSVGVEVLVKVGQKVEARQPVARLYGKRRVGEAEALVKGALSLSPEKVEAPPAILDSL